MSLIHTHRHSHHQAPEDERPTDPPVDLDEPTEEQSTDLPAKQGARPETPEELLEVAPITKTPNRLARKVSAAAVGVLILAGAATVATSQRDSNEPVSTGPVPTAGGEAPAQQPNSIYRTSFGQTIEYSYYPNETVGHINFLKGDNSAQVQASLDLANFYTSEATPAINKAIASKDHLKVTPGCFTQRSQFKNDAGELFTSLRAIVNPVTQREGDKVAYVGFQEDGHTTDAAVLYQGDKIVRAAFGANDPNFSKGQGDDRAVIFGGVVASKYDSTADSFSKYSGDLSSIPNIKWEHTGAVATDATDPSKQFIIGGVTSVVIKGDVSFAPEQEQAICAQLEQISGIND